MKSIVHTFSIARSKDDPEAFVCTSLDLPISAESRDAETAINFVKGATLCALGESMKEIPDKIEIAFLVDRSIVPHCDFELGVTPGVLPCKDAPTFYCGCDRCSAEDPFRSCAKHRENVEIRHERVYPNPKHRVVWFHQVFR